MPREVFDIFLSSTSEDLKAYREAVVGVISGYSQFSVKMESWGADPKKPFLKCKQEVLMCDALIVVVGHRYGWVPEKINGGDGVKSITWWEVTWALEANKPVYAFVVDPAMTWQGAREQDGLLNAKSNDEILKVGASVMRLKEFRDFLGSNTTWAVFSSPDNLGNKVSSSLFKWLIEKSTEKLSSEYARLEGASNKLPGLPDNKSEGGQLINNFNSFYWQERIHLFSAKMAAGPGEQLRIGLIAGKAEINHPALNQSSITQYDLRTKRTKNDLSDDFTTSVASLLVGKAGPKSDEGVLPGAHLSIFQILGTDYSSESSSLLQALEAAIIDNCKLVCLPLGAPLSSKAEQAIYDRIAKKGIIIISAAGNEENDQPYFPAAYPACLSVTAAGDENRLAWFANFHDSVAVAVPGENIPVAIKNSLYINGSGTSFSCGILTGVVGLMHSVNPWLTTGQIREILRKSGPPVLHAKGNAPAGKIRLLDAYHAVKLAKEAPVPKEPAATKKKPAPKKKGKANKKK